MQHQPVYCKGCRIAIATYDPERVQKGIDVWHRHCLREAERKEEAEKQKLLKMQAVRI